MVSIVIRWSAWEMYWIFIPFDYWLAKGHASSHVNAGSPNSRVSNFLETHGMLSNKKVYLQHGLIKDRLPFCFYNVTRADLYCCQCRVEKEYVEQYFGYPKGNVKQTGIARFDRLVKNHLCSRQILLMPTWRAWLSEKEYDSREQPCTRFCRSDYFLHYKTLLSDSNLHAFLEQNELELVFFHPDMQTYCDLFGNPHERIWVADAQHFEVQTLLLQSQVLITDYSSAFLILHSWKNLYAFFILIMRSIAADSTQKDITIITTDLDQCLKRQMQ